VFGRFTRLDDDRCREHGGAGLGPAIVAGIAARHGGDVHVADSERGARLVVRLPLAAAWPAGSGPAEPAAAAGSGSGQLAPPDPQQVDEGAVGGQPVDLVQLVGGQPA
jgi:hypothetical protein